MKKILVITLLVLFTGAFYYKMYIDSQPDTIDMKAAYFTFEENLAIVKNKEAKIEIKISNPEITSLELKLNDSTLQKWKSPKGNLSHLLKTKNLILGTKKITLIATISDNSTENDERLLRILNDKKPETWILEVNKEFPHRNLSYTQGLEFYNNELFEGTGDPNNSGQSLLAKVELSSGNLTKQIGLDNTHFGEGITILNDIVYQLTWKNEKCLTYNSKDLTVLNKEHHYSGEGWGLCNDGKYLIMSNGTEQLVFRDPNTFQVIKTIEATTNEGTIPQLNELEYFDGLIYANVYMQDIIAVINPNDGAVIAIIQASDISSKYKGNGEVLNGIAYNKSDNQLYITGKYWNKLLAVRIKKTI
jgi:glutamine cyclotransferase